MKKVIRLKESQLVNIIKRVIKEEGEPVGSGIEQCLVPLAELGFSDCQPAIDEAKKDPKKIGAALSCVTSKIDPFKPGMAQKILAVVKETADCVKEKIKPGPMPVPPKPPVAY